MKEYLGSWILMKEAKLGQLVEVGVLSSKDMYVKVKESIKNCIQVIEKLIADTQQV
jgi:hypothetical protein